MLSKVLIIATTILLTAWMGVEAFAWRLTNAPPQFGFADVENRDAEAKRDADLTTHRELGETGEEVRDEFQQTYPLSPTGRLSLENLNGKARIGVWDRNEVRVTAVKRASSRERLNEAKIDVNATPEAVIIKTVYPRSARGGDYKHYENPAVVEYSLTVPRKARLESVDLINGALEIDGVEGDVTASSLNGRVLARGLMGEAKLSTVNGSLEAMFTGLNETKTITLASVNGAVMLIIPSDAQAIVKASTVHGSISNDFGLAVEDGEYVGHELYGQLGNGGARIKLGNVNGQIAIKHAADGRKLSPAKCLLSQKNKDKDKEKALKEESRQLEQDQREAERDAERARRQAQMEVDREVERAMREAAREIEQAQREIQRETERQVREEMRKYHRSESTVKSPGTEASEDRFVDRESQSFAVTSKPNVNVGTFDGAITVRGWDKSEVMYTATKRAADEQQLKQITIKAEQEGPTVSIIASSDESNGSTSLEVFVPRGTALHASSANGQLNLQGVSGELQLRTGDGSIEVTDGSGELVANTGDGHIKIANFEGQVEAQTGDGSITLVGKFRGLSAITGGGSIWLSVPLDSHFTVETNAETVSNEGLTMVEDIAPSKRVRRWKIGGGGNVFVLKTGDGKIVLRPR